MGTLMVIIGTATVAVLITKFIVWFDGGAK